MSVVTVSLYEKLPLLSSSSKLVGFLSLSFSLSLSRLILSFPEAPLRSESVVFNGVVGLNGEWWVQWGVKREICVS